MKNTLTRLLLLVLALPLLLTACSDKDDAPATGTLQVKIQNIVGTEPLQLNEGTYTSPAGDTYSVSNLKYYISNLKLISSNGQATFAEPESYHLIAQGSKTSFELYNIPVGTYDKIELAIGVDEAHNHSTDQPGDLDPSNEMVWDWDTGYKFLSLVGTYTSNTRSGALVFHVGGDVNNKILTLDLPKAVNLREQAAYKLNLQADVNELFQGPNLIDFDEMNSGGHGAGPSMLAENYSNGFLKVVEVK